MVKGKYFLFGYREIFVKESIRDFAAKMIKARMAFDIVGDEKIIVLESDFKRFEELFRGRDYIASETLGMRGIKRRVKYKWAFCLSTLLGVILVILSSVPVWDVRISGNNSVPDTLIIEKLAECGFSVGSAWGSASLSDVEYDMLAKCDEISWININRVGTVANVKVIESTRGAEENSEASEYANIIADRDCVIEEITVSAGTPVVKVGDTVRKGDLLIIGVENNEFGRLVRAEGVVVGRAYDSLCTTVLRDRTVKTKKSESIISVNIKIFDFSINIFKKYGNSGEECDIIEGKRRITLFGKYKLPLAIETESAVFYELRGEEYNDGELVSVCSVRHRQLLKSRLIGKDLSKITTSSALLDDEYRITSDIVYSAEVGKAAPIKVE